MDPLLEKYLNDEITDEEFQKELDAKSDDEKSKIEQQARDSKGSTFAELKALRKEKNRQEQLAEDAKKAAEEAARQPQPQNNGTDYGSKFRQEQIQAAKESFFSKYSIPESERPWYESEFEKNDSGHVSADLIVNDFKRMYVSRNPDEFINARDNIEKMKEGAVDFMMDQAGGSGSGDGGNDGGKTYSRQAYDLVAQARKSGQKLTLEEADRFLKKGGERTLG